MNIGSSMSELTGELKGSLYEANLTDMHSIIIEQYRYIMTDVITYGDTPLKIKLEVTTLTERMNKSIIIFYSLNVVFSV